MNDQEIRAGVIAAIRGVAPEIEAEQLDAALALRKQVDLDSMDWLNVIIALHARFDIEIPESDYAKLSSLDTIVAYIAAARR